MAQRAQADDRGMRFDALFVAHFPAVRAYVVRRSGALVDGKKLLEFYSGGKLSLVAWKTPSAAYWVSNTLTGSIPAGQLMAIADSLQPAG